ncbi:hypothetical protein [Lacticaseibacillus mingshuiensis]|uniref:Uncharacterized protein n=1 Tax=Lacticaseibacillus mingshuiensis TaxID=2799574 RepID=A0ABW4CFK2_9LACO|nr:hypothetical protein [Lacticaseibacillus mingshuiensis]
MTSKNEVTPLLDAFMDSPEIEEIIAFPTEVIRKVAEGLGDVMEKAYHKPMQQWNADRIKGALAAIMPSDNATPDEEEVFETHYSIWRALLVHLAYEGKIPLTPKTLQPVLDEYEWVNGLSDDDDAYDDDDDPMWDMDINEDPSLPEWRESVYDDIQGYVDDWLHAFFISPAWRNHPKNGPELEQDFLEDMIHEMVDEGYNEYRKTPKSWSKAVLQKIYIRLGSTLNMSPGEWVFAVQDTKAFFTFLKQKNLLPAKRATDYLRYLEEASSALFDATEAGPETPADNDAVNQAVMQRLAAKGVDISDEGAIRMALQEMIKSGELNELLESMPVDQESDADDDGGDAALLASLDDPAQRDHLLDQADPDTKHTYLTTPHTPVLAGRKWQKKTATEVHRFAIETGIRLWMAGSQYTLPNGWLGGDVIGTVVNMMDMQYANFLLQPKEWTADPIYQMGRLMGQLDPSEGAQDILTVISAMLAFLTARGVLSQTTGAALTGALRDGFSGKEFAAPATKPGKVISFADAKKKKKK